MSNFIRQYANAMPDDLCETLIAWFDSVEDVKTVKADRITRKDEQKWLTFDQHSDLYTRVQKHKYDMMHRYKEEFPFCYRGAKNLVSPDIKVQCTPPFGGGFHNWHSEVSHYENMDRCLVWSFYLNDVDIDEGETEFLYEKLRVRPRKGLGVMFPAGWTFQHRGNPVHTADKYMTTGWWHYPVEKGYYK